MPKSKMPSSDTGGVKPMEIATRLVNERERLLGMSAEERLWRAQWLRDQHLAPHEPVEVPEYWQHRFNPIRRFYRRPLDLLFTRLQPTLGDYTGTYRHIAGKIVLGIFSVYAIHYYLKYHTNDWTKKGGWRVSKSRQTLFPGEEGYPGVPRTSPSDYAERGFKSSPI